MRRIDLAWAAGVFDGEGCVTTTSRDGHTYVTLDLGMTHKPSVLRLALLTGVGHVYRVSAPTPHSRTFWRWKVYRQGDVRKVLLALLPLSVTKKKEVATALRVLSGSTIAVERLRTLKRREYQ